MTKKYNVNSFADNMNKFAKNASTVISTLNGLSDMITSDEDVIKIDVIDGNDIQLPSYQNVLKRLKVVEDTVNAFTSGKGSVKAVDGTNRQVKVETLPTTPSKISNISTPSSFKTNANWFFESLMFPKILVSIDLAGKVVDDSDRVLVNRIIIPYNDSNLEVYNNDILNKNLSYADLITLLESKNISYYEDLDTLYFPLKNEKYIGTFPISKIEIIDGKKWYYLEEVEYGLNANVINTLSNLTLSKYDTLKYNNSLFEIENIDLTTNRVLLKTKLGLDTPVVGDIFTYYESPLASKEIDVPIGIDEINCVYFKGVNEQYNLVGNEWSDCVSFITNNLTDSNNESLKSYYQNYVADFGAEWISYAKEKRIPTYNGLIPNAPTLNNSDFKVVQINTQVNASVDNNKLNNLSSQITSLKSSIESSRNTISKLKTNLIDVNQEDERYKYQSLIANEENILSINTSEYKSLCNELTGYIKENNISSISPKYRIRGFFSIPEPKYNTNEKGEKIGKQEIIGFDIKYRYIKNDETGVELGTYTYNNGGLNINATFSDWNVMTSAIKEKVYNSTLDVYEWKEENVGDGNVININQIDIPITSGEKVEIMIRSISEAGYPTCPLKSEWSNSVIISFPSNLSSSNQLTNLIEDVNSDRNSIQLDDVLTSAGFYTHISDETTNPNDSAKSYHHKAENIYYKDNESLLQVIEKLTKRIEELEKNHKS